MKTEGQITKQCWKTAEVGEHSKKEEKITFLSFFSPIGPSCLAQVFLFLGQFFLHPLSSSLSLITPSSFLHSFLQLNSSSLALLIPLFHSSLPLSLSPPLSIPISSLSLSQLVTLPCAPQLLIYAVTNGGNSKSNCILFCSIYHYYTLSVQSHLFGYGTLICCHLLTPRRKNVFLRWSSIVVGVKPTYIAIHGNEKFVTMYWKCCHGGDY